jgi:hypothetical protein
LAQYEIKIISDSKQAAQDVAALEKKLKELEKPKKVSIQMPNLEDVKRGFAAMGEGIKNTFAAMQQLYGLMRQVPGGLGTALIGLENQFKALQMALIQLPQTIATGFYTASTSILKATDVTGVFTGSLRAALGAANRLTIGIAKIGFAFFGVTQAINMVQQAYMGFFNQTIGREIQLRETMLKTQTTLASTSKVFSGGKEITDPYEKIVTLTGAIAERIDSIRVRSLELAGVTSGEVVEVFNIVSSQIGSIGGGLKDAEDLAINFAAALGTFGIPLYQARQEIGSILRGDITQDSYLAKSLGITNQDVAKAKTATGGVVKFLQDKLAASVAGQKIAAQSFSGITSNIREVFELVSQNFGAGLLDPLLNGLTQVYDRLSAISKTLIEIAKNAGSSIGRIATTGAGILAQVTGLDKFDGSAAAGVASKMKDLLGGVFTEIEAIARRTFGAIATVITAIAPSVQKAAEAAALFAKAVIQINVGRFEAMVSTVTTLFQVFSSLLGPVAQLMQLYAALAAQPIVKFFAETATTLAILKRAGLDTIMTMVSLATILYTTLGPALASAVTFVGSLIGAIGGLALVIGKVILSLAALASSLVTPLAAIPAASAAMAGFSAALEASGNQAVAGATKMGMFARGLDALANSAKAAAFSLLASMGKFALIQIGIALLVKAYGDLTRAQDNLKASAKANAALIELATTYKDVGAASSSAARSAKAYKEAIVGSEYSRAQQRLEEINDWMDKLNDNATRGIRSFGDLWTSIGGLFTNTGALEKERKDLEDFMRKRDALEDEKNKKEDVTTSAQNAVQDFKRMADAQKALAREIADFKKQQEDTLWAKQQEVFRKDIEIAKTVGEIKIRDEERANLKKIEGVQGAAKVALTQLIVYLSNEKKRKLELQAAERSFQLDMAELDKGVADFRLETERKIFDLREKISKYEVEVAQYKIRAAKEEAQARNSGGTEGSSGGGRTGDTGLKQGNTGTNSTGDHYHVEGAANEREARSIFANSSNLTTTDRPGSPRDGGARQHAGWDLAGPKGTAFVLAPGYTLTNFVKDNFSKGGNFATVRRDSDGKEFVVRHIADPPKGWTLGAAGMPGNNTQKFLRYISELETGGKNVANAQGSGAQGYFQVMPATAAGAQRKFGIKSGDFFANSYETQATAVARFIAGEFPGAYSDIQNGNFDGAISKLRGNNAWPSLPGGSQARKPDVEKAARAKYLGAGGSAGGPVTAAGAPPAAPTLDASLSESANKFANLVESLKTKARQLLDLQKTISDATSREEFEKIGDNLFPDQEEAIRQYGQSIDDVQAKLQAIVDSGPEGFNERMFEVQRESSNLLKEAERTKQAFIDGLGKTGASAKQIAELTDKANKGYEKTVQQLKAIQTLKERQIELEKQAQFIRGLKDEVDNFDRQNNKDLVGFYASAATSMVDRDQPGGALEERRINAEAEIARKRIDREAENGGPLAGPALDLFNQLAEKIRASAEQFGMLEEKMKAYNEKVSQAREMTTAVIGGAKNLVATLVKGGNFKEAFANYLADVGGNFLDRGLDMLFKPLERTLMDTFKNVLGAKLDFDPKAALQEMNNMELSRNTSAVESLTLALQSTAEGLGTGNVPIDFSSEFSQMSNTFASSLTSAASTIGSSLMGGGGGGINYLSMGLNILKPLLGGLFGGAFAEGGDLPVGKASIVGERGIELIVPKSPMTVIPNKSLQMKGKTPITEQEKIAQSFRRLEEDDTIQNSTLDINYNVTATKEERYVTEKQFQAGINMASKQSEARVLNRLQNSRMTRDMVGMR